jgi:Flagellar hook-length control protein FliK
MTAPAAAAASAPMAPPAPRAPSQPPADRFAFAAMLDSLPGPAPKAGAATAEKQASPSDEPHQDQSPHGQPAGHSLLSDGSLLASLPFALQAASMMNEIPEAANKAPSPEPDATKALAPEDNGASSAASASTTSVGRLIVQRSFHHAASTSMRAFASRTLTTDTPLAPADAKSATTLADAAPSIDNPPATASTAEHAGGAPTNRVTPARAAAHEAPRGERKPEVSSPPPVAKVASPAADHAPPVSSGKAPDGRLPDPIAPVSPSPAQTSPFGAQLSASFATGPSFAHEASTASVSAADIAPRANSLAVSSTPSAPPVREIDVDLSPGGLEDVSMTMRLAGDKLSVVVRAASSQTLSSIEGARDAIADRLAAIGQPLDSLIVKQTGVNADGNTNGNGSSADSGSAAGEQRSAQDASEGGGPNDAFSRRGAGRDRGF